MSRLLLAALLLFLSSAAPSLAQPGLYRTAGPEYGVSVFAFGYPDAAARDLGKVQALGFGWVKSLFRWRDIERSYKGDLIVEAYRYARANWLPWIGVMSVWTLANPGWLLDGQDASALEQLSWAITNVDGSDRPAYSRLLRARHSGELPWATNLPCSFTLSSGWPDSVKPWLSGPAQTHPVVQPA